MVSLPFLFPKSHLSILLLLFIFLSPVLRLAFKYGFNALDTSPYYHPSEFILGKALRSLSSEYPRSTYFISTKCGRYGPNQSHFDYSPKRIKKSIELSIEKLDCGYLDIALLHDVEFVSENIQIDQTPTSQDGFSLFKLSEFVKNGRQNFKTEEEFKLAREEMLKPFGVDELSNGKVWGKGDEKILNAIEALFELKDQGKVRKVGISGYPLNTLLRITRMIKIDQIKKGRNDRGLDVILSYSNMTLHSNLLESFKELWQNDLLVDEDLLRNSSSEENQSQKRDEVKVKEMANLVNGEDTNLKESNSNKESLNRNLNFLNINQDQFNDQDSRRNSSSTSSSSSSSSFSNSNSQLNQSSIEGLKSSNSSSLDTPSTSLNVTRSATPNTQRNLIKIESYQPPLILNGSPFSMGLLVDSNPPDWHPASQPLLKASSESSELIKEQTKGKSNLAITALTYGIRGSEIRIDSGIKQRTVLGMSNVDHVHDAVEAYRTLLVGSTSTSNDEIENPSLSKGDVDQEELERIDESTKEGLLEKYRIQLENEKVVEGKMDELGVRGWSWASPPEEAKDL